MKRYVLIISGGSLFAWGASAAVAGCGGEEAEVAPADSDGGASSSGGSSGTASSSGGSSGGGSSSGTPGDGGGGDGGGGDGGGGDGGGTFASNPGKITCGATECTSATQACCQGQGGDAGCVADNMKCGFAVRLECDEKADCDNGDICCASAFGGGTSCQPLKDCGGFGEFVTCKTSAECAGQDGGTCKEYSCDFGKQTAKIRGCENPSPQNCK